MNIFKSLGATADNRAIAHAVDALRDGQVIIYPTDTFYAFGCDALNNRAIERLCRIKDINPDKQLLSVVVDSLSTGAEYARIDNRAFRYLKDYLPGPFTFVLPAATKLPKAFKGRKSVGLRLPDSVFARALAQEFGAPILTSSVSAADIDIANPEAIAMHFGHLRDIALLIDAGEGGREGSTVVDLTDSTSPEILRQGVGDIEL